MMRTRSARESGTISQYPADVWASRASTSPVKPIAFAFDYRNSTLSQIPLEALSCRRVAKALPVLGQPQAFADLRFDVFWREQYILLAPVRVQRQCLTKISHEASSDASLTWLPFATEMLSLVVSAVQDETLAIDKSHSTYAHPLAAGRRLSSKHKQPLREVELLLLSGN